MPALAFWLMLGGAGCASLVSRATSGMADSLSAAILNQDDPETVRDGAPAYLLMMDSFVQDSDRDAPMLAAAAELYAAYGIVFVDDAERARRLTKRSLGYAQRALCAESKATCEGLSGSFDEFEQVLGSAGESEAAALFTLGLSWLAYIQAHADDWSALADLPRVEAVLLRVQALDETLRAGERERYLGILNTLRPPALGGQFDKGRDHYERAIELTGGRDLGILVDYARFYARTLYDRDLHDRLLTRVLDADPDQPGHTLFNMLAQREARELLASADDYF